MTKNFSRREFLGTAAGLAAAKAPFAQAVQKLGPPTEN